MKAEASARFAAVLIPCLLALSLGSVPTLAAHHEGEIDGGRRVQTIELRARIESIDYETRQVNLVAPGGQFVTVTAGPQVRRLRELEVGDTVVATYIASLTGEVREPSEEEKAQPLQEMDAAAIAGKDLPPGAAEMRAVKAVCTIEGMNRVTGTAMIKGPLGNYHVITDIPPERFAGKMLGDTVVVTYTESIALQLEKAPASD